MKDFEIGEYPGYPGGPSMQSQVSSLEGGRGGFVTDRREGNVAMEAEVRMMQP